MGSSECGLRPRAGGLVAYLLLAFALRSGAAESWGTARDKVSGEIPAHQTLKTRPLDVRAEDHAARLAGLGLNYRNLIGEDCAVYVSAPLSDAQIAELTAQGIRVSKSNWVPAVPGRHAHGFYLASVDYAGLDVLRRDPRVVRVESTERLNRPHTDLGRAAINADAVQDGTGVCVPRDGTGVSIAIADSGIDLSHGDFPVPAETYDLTDGTDPSTWGANVSNTVREHGTHVAGIALGRGAWSPNNQYRGSAPAANLYFYKITDDTFGFAGDTDIIESVNRGLAVGCNIYSLSFGGISDPYMDGSSALCQAIDNATANGMVCVVSAGNDGNSNVHLQTSPPPGNSNFHCAYFVDNSGGAAPYTAQEWLQVVWRDGVSDGNIVIAVNNLGPGESLTPVFGNTSPRGTESRVYALTPNVAPGQTKMYCLQVQNTVSSGITPLVHVYRVAGAGQLQGTFASPSYTINHPGVADTAITVGAWVTRAQHTDFQGNSWNTGFTTNALAPFSSRGPRVDGAVKPDIVAPGSGIISCKDSGAYAPPWPFPLNFQTIDNDGQNLNGSGPANYYLQHGSSIATPLVAGGAALLLEAYPSLTPSQVRAALTVTASNAAAPDSQVGFGLIDVAAAINSFDCDNNASADECDVATNPLAFAAQDSFTNRSDRIDLAIGDFDGDNDPDLVEGRLGGDTLRWWRNDGAGNFARVDQFGWPLYYGEYMAAADLDGDGDVDIAAAERSNNQMRVLLNDGSGTFSSSATTFAYVVEEIAAADLDRDNDPDLVMVIPDPFNGYRVSVLLNNGNATFASPADYSLPQRPRSVAIGELDGDGFHDLIVTGGFAGYGKVSVLLSNGDGTFMPAVHRDLSFQPFDVTVLDYDADGDNDVAVSQAYQYISCSSLTEVVLLQNDGSGALTVAATYNGPNFPYCNLYHLPLVAGDLNGDGRPDLTIGAPGPAMGVYWGRILLNEGGGSFTNLLPTFSSFGLAPNDLALGDWNADGDLDLAAADNNAYFTAILNGTSPPTSPDCNANGLPDACDIAGAASADCQPDGTPDECQIAGNDCNANALPDDCDLAAGTSTDSDSNGLPDECQSQGTPAAMLVSAASRKAYASGRAVHDIPINPAGHVQDLPTTVSTEPRQGGLTELRLAFDVTPGAPGDNPVNVFRQSCEVCPCNPGSQPDYAPAGIAPSDVEVAGNELVLTFSPGLPDKSTYRIEIGADITNLPGQAIEVRVLLGDANSDAQCNATDRSAVVGVWTGSGFSVQTDLNLDGQTNATDRSLVVGAWTSGMGCAP